MSRWIPDDELGASLVRLLRDEEWALMVHDRLRATLLEQHPRGQWEVWAVCAALEEGIFLDLATPGDRMSEETFVELTNILVQRLSASEALASWAVAILAAAFGKETPQEAAPLELLPSPVPHHPESSRLVLGKVPVDAYAMLPISQGSFQMGSKAPDFGLDSLAARRLIIPPTTEHAVTLSQPFRIGSAPVTHGFWRHVRGRRHHATGLGGDDHPVTGVNFFDAIAFCNDASRAEGLEAVYRIEGDKVFWDDVSNPGYRLPTEAEWEFACRAGSTSRFAFGETLDSEAANYDGQFEGGSYRATTTPVGLFTANAWGLYDMHGNVHEWCWDRSSALGPEAAVDPRGPEMGSYRIVRGGGWTVWRGAHCASGTRMAFRPDMPGFDCGFRMILDGLG